MFFNRKSVFLFIAFVLPALAIAQNVQPEAFVVVELYTSEGCSSCPSGDNFLKSLKDATASQSQNVLLLAEHVPYWDYIGWKDPYAYKMFETMQREYCTALGSQVYTPMFVLNGEVITLSTSQIQSYIDNELVKVPSTGITLRLLSGPAAQPLKIEYDAVGLPEGTDIYIAVLESGLVSDVTRGENAGKTLKHENVVRFLQKVNLGTTPASVSIFVPDGVNRNNVTIAAFAKNEESLQIIAGTTGFDLTSATPVQNIPRATSPMIKIWPNPATDSFIVDFNSSGRAGVEMFNTNGVLMFKTNALSGQQLNVSSLPNGMYILRIDVRENAVYEKLLIQRTH